MNSDSPEVALPFQIHLSDALGLARAVWPGRSQILRLPGVTYYVDGAHTPESIEACVDWFLRAIDIPTDIKYCLLLYIFFCKRNARIFCLHLFQTKAGFSI